MDVLTREVALQSLTLPAVSYFLSLSVGARIAKALGEPYEESIPRMARESIPAVAFAHVLASLLGAVAAMAKGPAEGLLTYSISASLFTPIAVAGVVAKE